MPVYDLSDEDEENFAGLRFPEAFAGGVGFVLTLFGALITWCAYSAGLPLVGTVSLLFTLCVAAIRLTCRSMMKQLGSLVHFARGIIALEALWPMMNPTEYKEWYAELNELRAQLWRPRSRPTDQWALEWRDHLYDRWLQIIRQCPYPLK